MKFLKIFLTVFFISFVAACASSEIANLEEAKFALDQGNYSEAISKATAAISEDSSNVEAYRILASAYFGRSGLDFLDIAEGITDLQNSGVSNFQQIADVLPSSGVTLSDLRAAIETLEDIPGITATSTEDEGLQDAAFDLAIMQTVEHFALGVYGSGFFGTFDPTGISDSNRSSVQEDLINFDNRFILSGVDSGEDFISEIRQTFCLLEPLSAGEGFTTSEYQAFVGCELSDDPATFDTTAIDADLANCAALDPDGQGADVTACYDTNTAL